MPNRCCGGKCWCRRGWYGGAGRSLGGRGWAEGAVVIVVGMAELKLALRFCKGVEFVPSALFETFAERPEFVPGILVDANARIIMPQFVIEDVEGKVGSGGHCWVLRGVDRGHGV